MGMYTEIFVNVDFDQKTPKEFIDVLRAVCNKDKCIHGRPDGWSMLFNNARSSAPLTECGILTECSVTGVYSLIAKGDIENHEDEISKFFNFINPWCTNDFMGFYRNEDDTEPTLVYRTVAKLQ